jgi:hypothetical protein
VRPVAQPLTPMAISQVLEGAAAPVG